jgi:hypothetical protein
MDTSQSSDVAAKPNIEDLSAEVTKTIQFLKYSFFNCYRFQEERLEELVNLLCEGGSAGSNGCPRACAKRP